jgi:hypothetical protein
MALNVQLLTQKPVLHPQETRVHNSKALQTFWECGHFTNVIGNKSNLFGAMDVYVGGKTSMKSNGILKPKYHPDKKNSNFHKCL